MARWHAVTYPSQIEEDTWLSIVCFITLSLYINVIGGGNEIDEEVKERVKYLNEYMEKSIVYFSERIDLLGYQDKLIQINLALN